MIESFFLCAGEEFHCSFVYSLCFGTLRFQRSKAPASTTGKTIVFPDPFSCSSPFLYTKRLNIIESFFLCAGEDLNLHGLLRLLLRQVRLPISPPAQIFYINLLNKLNLKLNKNQLAVRPFVALAK